MLETTIKVSNNLRTELRTRKRSNESYNDYIVRLLGL